MPRFLSTANSAVLLLALGGMLGACSFSPARLTDEVRVNVREVQVWNDFMPGTKPMCHATLQLTLRNTTGRDIVLHGCDGLLANAPDGIPIRRFPVTMLYQDLETREVRLPPGMEIDLLLRTPIGVPAFDRKSHARVRFTAAFRTSLDRVLRVQSRPAIPFDTQ